MAAAQRWTMRAPRKAAALAAACMLAACSPALDWRDVRPEGSGLVLQMPCRPGAVERTLALAGAAQRVVLHSCMADGLTWGLAVADVGDPARVAPALQAWRDAAAANIAAAPATPADTMPLRVPGATPSAAAGRWQLQGRRPDGVAVQMQLALFTRGTSVLQATVLGPQVPAEAAEQFFGSLRFPP
ncbi:MAG: hypothetical protein KF683_13385 [Rubrivivax sp.]|nr:hypothetical protein [Rubrivivax sp.]